ncbi:dTDP-4-dehydrorhamnose 3,5-epimerase [Thermodesulfobacteriota bacterium]
MKTVETTLEGAYVIVPEPYRDSRGSFARIFCKTELKRIGFKKDIQQINHSLNKEAGALRGMHFQKPPKAEIKFVKCIKGSVCDVIVDIRQGSDTFLKWFSEILSAENQYMMYIPEGFAHGFQTLEPGCELIYFHTERYEPEYEDGIRFDDPHIGIKWPRDITMMSDRDKNFPLLSADFRGIAI